MWERAEFEVDESSNLVVAKTKHLSIWSLWYGFQKGMKPKFLDKNSASGSCEIRFWIYATSNPPCEFPHVSREYSVEDYLGAAAKGKEVTLRDVIMDYFSKSWDAYASKKFQMPTGKFDVFIDPESVDPDTKFCDIESVIIFPAPLEFWRPSEFKHNVAHELFHVIQNQYLNAISMGWGTSLGIGRKWWIEATADYAAAKVAWPHDDGVQSFAVSSLKPYYLEAPLDYFSDNEKDKFYYHQYQTSAFVDFLVSHAGVNFKEMWEYTASPSWRDIQDALDPLDKFLRSKKTPIVGIELTEGLREKYLQFAEFYLFDQNSPIPDSDTVPDGALNKKTELSSSKKKDVWEVKLDPDYTAKVWELSVSPEVGNSVILNVSFDSSSSDVVEMDQENPFIGIGTSGSGFEWVRIYKLEGFKRTSATEAYVTTIDAKDEKSAEVEISPWDGLYVLAINPYGSWLNLKLNASLSIPTLEIQRPFSESEKGVPETEYRFSLIKSNIPGDAEYEWDFGDGETADGESVTHKFSSEGDYTVSVQATWSGGSAENETNIEIEPPSVEIRRPFSEGQKGVPETDYTFSVIKKGIPDDAQYTWSFGDGGTASGESVIHKFAQEGDYTVKVSASWSGGSAEDETSIGIEAKACQRVSIWAPHSQEPGQAGIFNYPGIEQIFNPGNDPVTGYMPVGTENYEWSWSFGDGSPTETTHGIEFAEHTYSSPGVYTVEVTGQWKQDCAEGTVQVEILERPAQKETG
jgi:PKD repeat protein